MCCSFLLRLPENLPLDASAPLLCAGITTYSPIKHYGLDKPGTKLGVIGLGGLGHMAVKIGKAMGLEVSDIVLLSVGSNMHLCGCLVVCNPKCISIQL